MKSLDADIAIVSAGTAGLSATVTAAEGGAKVIAFEKTGHTGGTANHGSGIFAVESRLQKTKQYPLSKEEAFKIYMDFTHWRVNARLVKALIDKSSESIDWLEELGVKFLDISSHGTGNYYTQHTIDAPEDSERMQGRASSMMTILANRAKQLEVPIYLKTPAQKLIKDGNRIVGVIANNESGEQIQVNAKAVILATGAFGMHFPLLAGNTGDGIRMAKEIGAIVKEASGGTTIENKQLPIAYRWGGRRNGFLVLMSAFQQPVLIVNKLGERFMNEELIMSGVFLSNAINRQPDQAAFVIFDEATKETLEKSFDIIPGGIQQPFNKAANFDAELNELIKQDPEAIIKVNSIEELCSRTGIDREGLFQTLNEYNKSCECGKDEVFGKIAKYLRPIKQPPFYARRYRVNPEMNWVGIKVNHKTEVIGTDNRVIPGLYAAGMEIACEVYHDTYPYILPATAMGFAIHGGRMAAESALEFLKSNK